MKKTLFILTLSLVPSLLPAQNLTPAQKDADFRYLASLYNVFYAPVDWKKQLFNFDALAVKPWLDRVAATTTDLDFYELCVEYVASLNDTHDSFSLPSDFVARLGFTTDVYDGVLLIDSLNRTQLPAVTYPFTIGDELVSIDGRAVEDLLKDFAKYGSQGNPISSKRLTAARLTIRPQSVMPHAPDVLGKSALVIIKRQSGALETYNIPWVSTGTPLEAGPVSPFQTNLRRAERSRLKSAEPDEPDYMTELRNVQWSGVLNPDNLGLNGYGARNPVFLNALPSFAFTRRLGGATADFFYSGTFKFAELTIGYIRIPNYAPPSTATALSQFQAEIAFMNANTDGLIVDEMHNTGGNLCFGEDIASRLIPNAFRATGFQLRPYWTRMLAFYNSMISAKANGAPLDIVQQYESIYTAMFDANRQGKRVTDTLPICTSSLDRPVVLDSARKPVAYGKTLMMLIDEFSTSTADSVPAMLEDSGRAILMGMRTNGAGGNNTSFDTGSYSEGVTGMTLALQVRPHKVGYGYPFTDLIENVGVHPAITADIMTKDNLLKGGAPFLFAVLSHMAAEIRAKQ